MKDLIKYGLLATGAYLLARQFGLLPELQLPGVAPAGNGQQNSDGQPAGDGQTTGNGQPAGSDQTGGNGQASGQQPPPTIVELMKARSGQEYRTWDQWNWYYAQITGKPGPAPEAVGVPRVDPMPGITAEEWAALATGGGFAL